MFIRLNKRATKALKDAGYITPALITGDDVNTAPDTLTMLTAYAAQSPGLDGRDYMRDFNDDVGRRAYNADARKISRQWSEYVQLLRQARLIQVTDADITTAAEHAFSGRVSLIHTDRGWAIDYTVGQYWPTEYRAACVAVLSDAILLAEARQRVTD